MRKKITSHLHAAAAEILLGAVASLGAYSVIGVGAGIDARILWDAGDPLTLAGLTVTALSGIAVIDFLAPFFFFPMWKKIDGAILRPRRKRRQAEQEGLEIDIRP